MRKVALFRSLLLCTAVPAVLALAAPRAATAGTIRIYPQQFRVEGSTYPAVLSTGATAANCVQTLTVISAVVETPSPGTECRMVAPVRLPAGKRVTKFSLASWGMGGSAGSGAYLTRNGFLDGDGLPGWETVAGVTLAGEYPKAWYPHDALQNRLIKRGGTYWVEVRASNNGSFISGVEIRYR